MSKDSNTQHRATRQHPLTKIIVERHYVGTEKMETVFKRIAEEQITKKVKPVWDGGDKTDADRQRMVYAMDMFFVQPPDIPLMPLLADCAELFKKHDGRELQAAFSVDKVVGGQLRLCINLA